MPDLEKYNEKRNKDKTPEPEGSSGGGAKGKNIFVIQKHDASNLHYDFRIEIDGVLKSWAVPKGPSTDPSDKRLMVLTEDHPLEYADFEGVIPEDEYGGGTVMIWDKGEFDNITEKDGETKSLGDAFDDGEILVDLHGEKIYGGYAIVKFRGDDQWLLIKKDDDQADARRNPTSTESKSVASDRTLEEIDEEEEAKTPLEDE